jgi:UDP-GlcNAc:undecaprenyl-phosphate GlcNAc-1-phosphate transferase
MDIFLYISTIPITIFLMVYLKPRVILLLYTKGLRTSNYHGKEVVYGTGLAFLIPCILSVLPLWEKIGKDNFIVYLVMLLSMTLMGYLDDSLGDSTRKGFKDHISGLLSGYLTTGIIKIVLALIIGFIISKTYYTSLLDIAFHSTLFCLCVNFINLLDLRPGRAIKGFTVLVLFISLFSNFRSLWIILPIFSGLSIYIKDEMNERCMLGDTGSNLLGGVLGLYILNVGRPWTKFGLYGILLILHFIAEFRSISEIIDSSSILKRMDSLGQLKEGRS